MPQSYPVIDYEDMLDDLNDDIESKYIKEDDVVFIVRQNEPVFCEAYGDEVYPVIDYFYSTPALLEQIQQTTVADAKKYCFTILERLNENGEEALSAAVSLIINDLKDYTAGAPKRNDRLCKVVLEKESHVPMMVYFDDVDVGDHIEAITVSDLLEELNRSSGQ